MKYRIEFSGRGGEIAIGQVKREFYDAIQANEADFDEYAWNWDYLDESGIEIPEDIRPFEPGEWFDCDNICHNNGPSLEDCYITVISETEEVIYNEEPVASLVELGMDYESREVYPQETLNDGDVYFIGQSFEKGLFLVYEVEAETFDPAKLVLQVEDCDGWELIVGASYDGVALDDLGELSTSGKGSEFQLVLIGNDEDDA